MAWSPDNKYIAVATKEAVCRVYDTATGETLFVNSEHKGPITSLAWSKKRNKIVSVSEEGRLQTWSINPNSLAWSVFPPGGCKKAVWDPEGTAILVAGERYVSIYDAFSGGILSHVPHLKEARVVDVDWSPDGKFIAVATKTHVDLYDASKGTWEDLLEDGGGQIEKVQWSPSGEYLATLATVGTSREIVVWRTRTKSMYQVVEKLDTHIQGQMAWWGNNHIAVFSNRVEWFDRYTGTYVACSPPYGDITTIACCNDCLAIASASDDRVYVYPPEYDTVWN
jgi:WD40 repeat protein